MQRAGNVNGCSEIQLDYDTETKETIPASFQGFPRQVFTSDVDTTWNLTTGDGTYILGQKTF
ncbi:MAG: hypothetical protein AAGI53_03295 [Planctomycetota bacterium]